MQKMNGISLGKGRMKSILSRKKSMSKRPWDIFLLSGDDGVGRMSHGVHLLQGTEWPGSFPYLSLILLYLS